ncbi:fam-a protein [Plasmodium yoelii]|uniref:Fam-a protein n=2 Tax=Plasmodium yoelii TaxID=5861 RepID=A0AAE9X183_PLAYO|nr:fam-a protein [Plasmodium yoelii]WBY60008.1 fam-a protein [Plasmodium yoelii yoelii]CDU19940.1 fam-a protein [Plasmodium yoelii]VTZ80698.1 fam-a protein [Plasmodium yoelii]|eukprot:XP_022813604.1 fam-a protein [Plasmodium yoelii]
MNKRYIKIALALLSVAGYMQNVAFARDSPSSPNSPNKQLPIDPEEAKQASAIMSEALAIAQKHAEHTDDYEEYSKEDDGTILYFKKVNNVEIGKIELTIPNPNNYNDVVNMLWDPNGAKNFDDKFIKGSIPRVYNPNLVIIQQRYKSLMMSWQRYYHALANKVELSKDQTALILVSSNMNDHDGGNNKKYVNPIVESANSFKPDIDSEEDIRNGDLYKMYVHLVAVFIKKEADCVKVTYISSIEPNAPSFVPSKIVKKILVKKILNITKLKDIFKN